MLRAFLSAILGKHRSMMVLRDILPLGVLKTAIRSYLSFTQTGRLCVFIRFDFYKAPNCTP